MRITIDPTDDNDTLPVSCRHASVSISVNGDDLTADEFFAIMRRAAVAWGFGEQTVREYMGPEQ